MIWIIGEYAERIDNADELLESFLETFPEEPAMVQLQLLTATVKLFLKKPTDVPQQMIQVTCLFLHFLVFTFFFVKFNHYSSQIAYT
jgi:vesicle coat complex subunit